VIVNARPADWNRCGQAAVATVLAHYRVGPFAGNLTNNEAMDRLSAEFPPDVPFGLGTSVWRLREALESYGLSVEHVHSGWFNRDANRALSRLEEHMGERRPAVVCLDHGLCGGEAWSAHWAVMIGLDSQHATIAGRPGALEIPRDEFQQAWRCRHLPHPHNHCALLLRG
jgi:hypothetical protein